MRVSLIVAVYKDVEALSLIVDSLQYQTYKNFELIVAEDGQHEPMKEFVQSIKHLHVKHTTQEDIGVRKARSQNNAILASTGEYLIFIDGDCILHSEFIASHVALSQSKTLLCGRRLNLNESVTKKLRDKELITQMYEKQFWINSIGMIFNRESRFEQALYFNPNGFIYKNIINKRERNRTILGCNFSCFKDDMLSINGFDESYGQSAVSDDMDLDWRFRAFGLKLNSCKNSAIMYHLFHKAHNRGDATAQVLLMREREKSGTYFCEVGLNTH